jgi:hypothetical protein
MVSLATLVAAFITSDGRSAWFVGVLVVTRLCGLCHHSLPVATASVTT